MGHTDQIPREFEVLDLDVDTVDEDGAPWAFVANYEESQPRAEWSTVLTPGWVLTMEWVLDDDAVVLNEMRIRAAQSPRNHELTSEMASKVKLGRAYYIARRLFRWSALGAMLPDAWLRAIEPDGLGVPKPGRPGGESRLCAEWAAKYVDALDRDPRRPVALLVDEHPGDTEKSIRARLTRARQLKLLTAAPAGKPGGRLTKKAQKILEERNA